MKRIKYLVGILFIFIVSCSESLEDTYSDYSGDGKIRYVGKCSDMSIKAGWCRLQVNWKNSTDAVIDKIKVSWEAEEVLHDTLLPRDATFCDIKNLTDAVYRVDVCAVDVNGKESLAITDYARPYSYEHEAVRSFSRVISKYYYLDDNLVYYIDNWNDSIVEAKICYTNSNSGAKEEFILTKEEASKGLLRLENVNCQKPITIARSGRLDGCSDLINFADYTLTNERIYSSDFKLLVQIKYGLKNENEEQKRIFDHFVDTVKVLEFDYDIASFEDLFYCSKLEKIILGKNRYLSLQNPNKVDISVCANEERSLECLDLLNDVRGVVIERYNEHYFDKTRSYFVEMGNPQLPILNYLASNDIESIQNLTMPEDSEETQELRNLLDNNPSTWWEPSVATSPRTYEIVLTLKQPQVVKGVKIVQRLYRPTSSSQKYYVSDKVVIEVSADNVNWESISYAKENEIGIGSGEVTLIPMVKPVKVKYIKVTLSDKMHGSSLNFNMTLSGIVPYI